MKLYLAPEPSLELIRYLRSTSGTDGLAGSPMRRRSLKDAINTVRGVNELDETAQKWLMHIGRPIHAFVPHRSKGTNTKHLVTHVFGQAVPFGAFLEIGHDVCICTPQFTLLQMAADHSLLDIVRIGMELCGFYSQWRLEPNEMGDPFFHEHNETRSCTFNLPPAIQANRMNAFVERLSNMRGSKSLRAALKWIVGGSASPMETAVYLQLCLPKRLGGYGLPKPVLNPKLNVSNPDGVKVRYPDLFWHGPNIDVECNSDSDHSGEWSRYRDSKREIELTVANVKVLPLTRLQLMDTDDFDSFAQGLRRMLGVRKRSMDPNWKPKRIELRKVLLAGWK